MDWQITPAIVNSKGASSEWTDREIIDKLLILDTLDYNARLTEGQSPTYDRGEDEKGRLGLQHPQETSAGLQT